MKVIAFKYYNVKKNDPRGWSKLGKLVPLLIREQDNLSF